MIHMNKLLCGLLICLLLTSCDSPRKSQRTEPEVIKVAREQKEMPKYTVKEGDTVGSVALENNITRADLIELNDLTPPYELYAGQKLVVKQQSNSLNDSTDTLDSSNDEIKLSKSESVQDVGLYNNVSSSNNLIIIEPQNDPAHAVNSESQVNNTKTNNTNDAVIDNNNNNNNKQIEENVLIEEKVEDKTSNKQQDIVENKSSKYIWPVDKTKNRIVKNFRDTKEYTIIHSSNGTPVIATADGVVQFAGTSQSEGMVGYGKMVILKHSNPSRLTMYAKLGNINVTKGQKIKKGTKIGTVAKNSDLYFSLMNVNNKNKRTYIDPNTVLK